MGVGRLRFLTDKRHAAISFAEISAYRSLRSPNRQAGLFPTERVRCFRTLKPSATAMSWRLLIEGVVLSFSIRDNNPFDSLLR